MKIIIDIPEEEYRCYKHYRHPNDDKEFTNVMIERIAKGTPLQKEHGGLMILSKDKLKENQIDLNFSCQKWISEVGLSYATISIIEAESEDNE